ncbi:MAG: 2-oxo-4-hydroxy-4-carboxy-5-ureidoimidazoline decarboxylase [Bauldia sp.]|nr:2-oxo-4-hydroxy-4-carboxy-5-ureidoimidazoline decarboxylase [Bauldia sp.]
MAGSPAVTPAAPLSIAAVNALSDAAFVSSFGDVAEHSPWVAERAAAARPFASRDALLAAFAAAIDAADPHRQLALLRAHPDLAGRAAIAGELAPESTREQAGAGLGSLTPDEFARFTELNDRYRARFRFPFILAVRGATKDMILASFAERVERAPHIEFATAMEQVRRIVSFRLEDRVAP